MTSTLLENSSQNQNDHFVLECVFFLLIITMTYYCITRRKKVYAAFLNHISHSPLSYIRLYIVILMLMVVCILFVLEFTQQLLS